MYRDHTIGVVVPAYNEQGFIGDVIRSMPEYVDRIFVVDDKSTDGTWTEILDVSESIVSATDSIEENATTENPEMVATDGGTVLNNRATVSDQIGRVVPIRHRENLGAGGAIKTGYLAALADRMDITVTVDGDGQMDLSQMPKLLDPIVDGEADYAKGNRLLSKNYRSSMPTFRFVGNWILTFLTKIASGYWKTMDPQNGYTAISRNALEAIDLESMYEYYGYCNDLLIRLNTRKMRVADVALPAIYGDEESSINYGSYIPNVSSMLLRNFLWRLKTKYLVMDFHPLALFYLLGASTVGIGSIGGLWSIYTILALGNSVFFHLSVSFLIFLAGCILLLFAMLFDMWANEGLETKVYG